MAEGQGVIVSNLNFSLSEDFLQKVKTIGTKMSHLVTLVKLKNRVELLSTHSFFCQIILQFSALLTYLTDDLAGEACNACGQIVVWASCWQCLVVLLT